MHHVIAYDFEAVNECEDTQVNLSTVLSPRVVSVSLWFFLIYPSAFRSWEAVCAIIEILLGDESIPLQDIRCAVVFVSLSSERWY